MKRDRRTSFFLTLLLIFMFAVFGGGSALGIIKLPFLPMSGDTASTVSNTANKKKSESPGINIPAGIQIYNPQVSVSSKNEDIDSESSALEDIKNIANERDHSFVAELAGSTANSSENTSSTTASDQTGISSSSSNPVPADPGTGSSSNSSSSGGTVIPSTRPKPSPSGGGGSHSVAVQSVTLDQSDVTINRKNTLQLVATVTPQNATKKTVTWTTSNKDVATVDSTGNVIGIGAGTTTITATAANKTAACEVTIVVLMDGISLNHTELSIDKGSTEQLTAKITPEDTTDDKTIAWTSTGPDIVSVDSAGKVTALKPGKATIRASAVGASASCEITVLSPMTGIALDKSTLTLNRNTTDKLTVSFLPDDTTSGREVTWSSSAPEVADVDHQGNVVAHIIGTATITASCGDFTATCNVTVIALIDGVYLDQSEMTLDRGTDGHLTESIVPMDTTEDKTVVWTSSNPNIAAVDSTGNVSAIHTGLATITAKVGEHTASCNITVVALIHNISLNKTELMLDRGISGQLAVSYDPADTTEDKTITWTSSNPDVATVDAAGNVTAVQIGTATITGQVGTHTTTCSVTVVALIHSILLDKDNMTLDRGANEQLVVSYDPPDTTEDKTVTWSSSDPTVATVDSTGNVTAVQIGSTTITAQVGTRTTTCSVTVMARIHSISLDKTDLTLDRGATRQLTVAYDPSDTTDDKTVIWTSSDPTVATVDSTGKVTAVKIGSTTITATVGTHTSVCTINVEALIHSISLDKTDLTLNRGITGQLTVSYDPPDTTESKAIIWSSSNTSIATVDNYGKITGINNGTATITASVGSHTANCTIIVGILINNISLDKTNLTLDRGTTGQLNISINPIDTTESKAVTWSSNDSSIATVDSSGKVTGVKIGTTTITAKVGTHSTSCSIKVVALIHSISLNKTYSNLDKGGRDQLTVSFDPSDTTESKTIYWSSSNPAIASVNSSGKVTAGTSQVGETTITAKVGIHTATCVIGVGVKYTVTTEEEWKSSGMNMDFFSDGSGKFTVWENDKKAKSGKGDLYIKFSKAINIPTNNHSISITFKDYDEDGSPSNSGTVDLYYPSPISDNSSFSLSNGKRAWSTENKNTTEVHLHFYGRVKANSKESGYVGVYWDSGSLVVFGIPITSSSGYLDL